MLLRCLALTAQKTVVVNGCRDNNFNYSHHTCQEKFANFLSFLMETPTQVVRGQEMQPGRGAQQKWTNLIIISQVRIR